MTTQISKTAFLYYELFLLDLATGLRRDELMALQWDDLNFKTGVLNVNKQVYEVWGELQLSAPNMLDHVSTATTLDIYTHITDDMQRMAAANIDRGIGKAAPQEAASVLGQEPLPRPDRKSRR